MAIMNDASDENSVTKSASNPFADSAHQSHIWLFPNLLDWLQTAIFQKIHQIFQTILLRSFLERAE